MRPSPTDPAPSATAAQVLAGLAKLSLVMRHEAWRASGERGLTPTQAQILAVVAGRREPVGLTAIARQLAVTPATASEAVSTLVEKGLLEKRPDPGDGRAVMLRLTRSGRRESQKSEQWPQSLLSAIESLPSAEQGALLRGLVGVVRSLQARGSVPTARMCVECRFFRPNEHPNSERPHHCLFIGGPIADNDLKVECSDMSPAPHEDQERLWSLLVEGRRLDASLSARPDTG